MDLVVDTINPRIQNFFHDQGNIANLVDTCEGFVWDLIKSVLQADRQIYGKTKHVQLWPHHKGGQAYTPSYRHAGRQTDK